MDIVHTGRHIQITDAFRAHADEKLQKVGTLAPSVHRIDVVVTHEPIAGDSERVEITCHGKRGIARAEARHADKVAAFDMAAEKLIERIRKSNEKRQVHRTRRGRATLAAVEWQPPETEQVEQPEEPGQFGAVGDSPIKVREKVHSSTPMTLEDALRNMELVGHDFFLYIDVDTGQPSVLYRRRGWNYGVIHLDVEEAPDAATG